jgi:hypothetical protein
MKIIKNLPNLPVERALEGDYPLCAAGWICYELSTIRLGTIRIDVAKLEKFGDVFMID